MSREWGISEVGGVLGNINRLTYALCYSPGEYVHANMVTGGLRVAARVIYPNSPRCPTMSDFRLVEVMRK